MNGLFVFRRWVDRMAGSTVFRSYVKSDVVVSILASYFGLWPHCLFNVDTTLDCSLFLGKVCGQGFVVDCIDPVGVKSMCSWGTAERVVTGDHSGDIHSHGYSSHRGLCALLSMNFERWISVQ